MADYPITLTAQQIIRMKRSRQQLRWRNDGDTGVIDKTNQQIIQELWDKIFDAYLCEGVSSYGHMQYSCSLEDQYNILDSYMPDSYQSQ